MIKAFSFFRFQNYCSYHTNNSVLSPRAVRGRKKGKAESVKSGSRIV